MPILSIRWAVLCSVLGSTKRKRRRVAAPPLRVPKRKRPERCRATKKKINDGNPAAIEGFDGIAVRAAARERFRGLRSCFACDSSDICILVIYEYAGRNWRKTRHSAKQIARVPPQNRTAFACCVRFLFTVHTRRTNKGSEPHFAISPSSCCGPI